MGLVWSQVFGSSNLFTQTMVRLKNKTGVNPGLLPEPATVPDVGIRVRLRPAFSSVRFRPVVQMVH
jgi:hypothetical protein